MQEDFVGAKGKYREAIELGERDPDAIRRLFVLYADQKQYREANELLRLLPKDIKNPESFQLLEVQVSLQTYHLEDALRLASGLAPETSNDYRQQLQRYRVFLITAKNAVAYGRKKEEQDQYVQAEAAVRRALDLAPQKPDPWVAAVQYFVTTSQKAEAEKLIEVAKGKINEDDKLLALAQCYEMTGNFDMALDLYETALKARPDDIAIRRNFANFQLFRGNTEEARKHFEQILKSSSLSVEDRRSTERLLAIVFAVRRDNESSRRALEVLGLLDANGIVKPLTGNESAQEIHARAVTLALLPELSRKREAIKLLEARQDLPNDDLFLLAELQNLVGNWRGARVILGSLVKSALNPLYLQYYAFHLIAHSDLAEADKIVTDLEKLQPNAIQTVELRARVMAASGEITRARDILLQQAGKPNANVAGIARLLEELGAPAAAEPLYQRLIADSKKPETSLLLAEYYSRQNRIQEALRICEELGPKVRPEIVGAVAVSALYSAQQPRGTEIKQVLVQLDGFLRQHPESPALLSYMAAALNIAGDYTGAISYYRKAIAADPKDIAARNNLAYLVSAHEKRHDEALQELDRAEKMFGRQATLLLDTKAQVYIAKKEPGKAIALLEQLLDERQKGSYYFHLAQAYLIDNKVLEARIALKTAHKDYHLKAADLHALERPEYQKLASKFESP
jgi:tetratricopeptide (TPR) repeat protein